jgi:hypothetical protein
MVDDSLGEIVITSILSKRPTEQSSGELVGSGTRKSTIGSFFPTAKPTRYPILKLGSDTSQARSDELDSIDSTSSVHAAP